MSFFVHANVSTAAPKHWVSRRYHCWRIEQLQFLSSVHNSTSVTRYRRETFHRRLISSPQQFAAAKIRSPTPGFGATAVSREHSNWPRRSEEMLATIVCPSFCISSANTITSWHCIASPCKRSSFRFLAFGGRDEFRTRRKFHITSRLEGRYICATSSSVVKNEDTSKEYGVQDLENLCGFDDLENEVLQETDMENTSRESEDSPSEVWVVNFYHFVNIEDPHLEVARHTSFMKIACIESKRVTWNRVTGDLGITGRFKTAGQGCPGRIYISHQGINAQLSGPGKEAVEYAEWVKEDLRFSNMLVQISPSPKGHAFPRLRLRYKPSLVQVEGGTLHLPITEPSARAVQLTPREWFERLEAAPLSVNNNIDVSQELQGLKADNTIVSSINTKRPIVLLDVRNGYEWDVGHFNGAQRPNVDCFKSTEFGLTENEPVRSDPLANVDKEAVDVMMYCTGGIRCDVFSTMLRHRGFRNLYTLKGGVSNYLKEEGPKKWAGNLFVFDSRLAISPKACHREESSEGVSTQSSHTVGELDCVSTSTTCTFARCRLCGDPISEPRHRNCANLDCNILYLSCGGCLTQHKGCCSRSCSLSTKLRPPLVSQQYDRWHKYRPQEPKSPKPDGYISRRALKRRRRKERRKQLIGATIHQQLIEPILGSNISLLESI